jgi:N-formylglutamate amidohydrolase
VTRRLPDWCRIRRGAGPLVLVAPHGGRRASDELCQPNGRRLKINDLHTAELAEELAERLDASLLANCALDRNELDLNRVSAIARSAPWFLAELGELVSSALERHPVVEVVVVHGWHVVQPKCDVGID